MANFSKFGKFHNKENLNVELIWGPNNDQKDIDYWDTLGFNKFKKLWNLKKSLKL